MWELRLLGENDQCFRFSELGLSKQTGNETPPKSKIS